VQKEKRKINNDDGYENRIAAYEEMGSDAAESIIKGSNLKTCQRSFAFDLFFCSSSKTHIHMFPTLSSYFPLFFCSLIECHATWRTPLCDSFCASCTINLNGIFVYDVYTM
jgi:hypothetical protein